MLFERVRGEIWIGMSEDEFDLMQEMFAHALGAVDSLGRQDLAVKYLRFVYALNAGNERFKGQPLPVRFLEGE